MDIKTSASPIDMMELQKQVETACLHLLSEQNRDPYSPTYGCFDRRYWGWKLVDFPEATFQRNVYPLAWLLSRMSDCGQSCDTEFLVEAVQAGLRFTTQIQHKDGSFDQAFPQEHSFGATAFLLHPLLEAYRIAQPICSISDRDSIELSLHRAADFLCCHDELHGHIANHVAGAVLSLLVSAQYFGEPRYEQRANTLLERILAHQSSEGWFLEYEGADPGYQTLCLYYLAQVYRLQPDAILHQALESAIGFLAWFIHPDGTFGGVYGSRRTAVFYPGGLALLSSEFPLAHRMTASMMKSITAYQTVTLRDIDIGNLAPLLSNYIISLDENVVEPTGAAPSLPCQRDGVRQDFSEAGLYIRSTPRYYTIVGVSNGGVIKVFDRSRGKLIWNDGGYVGQLDKGAYITTQMTVEDRPCHVTSSEITLQTPFYYMLRSVPTPFQFVLLRCLNLTLMRHLAIGNYLKKVLVRLLISGKRIAPLQLTRTIVFEKEGIHVTDVLTSPRRIAMQWLKFGRPFVAIHMASAQYFEGGSARLTGEAQPFEVDVETLSAVGELQHQVTI